MKKQIALFLVFLMVFNFISCTKSMTNENSITGPEKPNQDGGGGEDDIPAPIPPKMEFMYLDENNNRSEQPTDKIIMQLNSETASNFIMISEKTKENQYTTYLSDTSSGTVISMVYENNANFPKRITIFNNEELLIGTPTSHRSYSEDFDILWNMDNETEAFEKIPLKNDIYNYDDVVGLNANINYQLKTTIISVRIWAAISQYVQDSPMTYSFWSRIKNAVHKAVAAISAVVAVVIAVFFPPLIPIAGIYIASVGGFICGTIELLAALEPVVKNKEEEKNTSEDKFKNRILIVRKDKEPNTTIRDGSYFNLGTSTNNFLFLEYHAAELNINNCSIKLKMENEDEDSYTRMYGLFKFYNEDNGLIGVNQINGSIINLDLSSGAYVRFSVKKISQPNTSEKPIYIEFTTTDDNVMINDAVSKTFRIYLHK